MDCVRYCNVRQPNCCHFGANWMKIDMGYASKTNCLNAINTTSYYVYRIFKLSPTI